MRQPTAAVGLLILALSAPNAQQSSQVLDTLTAINHVGEVATVCGRVADYTCRRGGNYATLTLVPAEHPVAVSISILSADGQSKEHLDDRYFDRTVCVRGTIEKVVGGLQISVPDPTRVEVKERAEVLPPIPNDAYSSCNPDVVLPVPIREVKPQYTAEAMRARVSGRVKLRGVVDTDGVVRSVQVMRSLHPSLDEQAIEAFRQWRFRPGTYMGTPVPVAVTADMAFSVRSK